MRHPLFLLLALTLGLLASVESQAEVSVQLYDNNTVVMEQGYVFEQIFEPYEESSYSQTGERVANMVVRFPERTPANWDSISNNDLAFLVGGYLPDGGDVVFQAFDIESGVEIEAFKNTTNGGSWSIPTDSMQRLPVGKMEIRATMRTPGFRNVMVSHPFNVQNPQSRSAIAGWDVVPHQEFCGQVSLGVVAFHTGGIDRVEFSLDGENWTPVSEATENPRTGVVEYAYSFNADELPRGAFNLRAVAYPTLGTAYHLPSLPLFASPGDHDAGRVVMHVGTDGSDTEGDGSAESPYATVGKAAAELALANEGTASGGVIALLAGEHTLDFGDTQVPTTNRWLTIRPADGAEGSVTVAGTKGTLGTELLKLENLKINWKRTVGSAVNDVLFKAPGKEFGKLWFAGCELAGQGRLAKAEWYPLRDGHAAIYATDTSVTSSREGFVLATFVRNVEIDRVARDAFSGTKLVINSSVNTIDPTSSDGESVANQLGQTDVYQFIKRIGRTEQVILYGLEATGSIDAFGIFGGAYAPLSDIAIVNCTLDNISQPQAEQKQVLQLLSPATNLLVQGSSFTGNSDFGVRQGFLADHVVFADNQFNSSIEPSERPLNWEETDVIFRNSQEEAEPLIEEEQPAPAPQGEIQEPVTQNDD